MLPLISHKKYLGLINKKLLIESDLQMPLQQLHHDLTHPYLIESQHIYDVFAYAANHHFSLLPVLNQKQEYVGLITKQDIIASFASFKSLQVPGSIVVLQVPLKDYQLSHIIQIIESNDANALNVDVQILPDFEIAEVTIKINRIDLSRIESAFYRHNYVIKSLYHKSQYADELNSRYDSLMNYLNM
ncbi:MAG TPA: CBS domain-containing protein, partial [Bacteroidia bacterium]|nr:CBS domain-containing protein [Bacteroidia bacterium]